MMQPTTLTGVGYALAGAICFGIATPVLQWAAASLGTFTSSALLYAGAAAGALLATTLTTPEPPVERHHIPRIALLALLSGALAPSLLIFGLARSNGAEACLLLNVEAVVTAVLGAVLYREPIGWRFIVGLATITAAACLLVSDGTAQQRSELIGLAAVCAAMVVWSIDNAVIQPLVHLDSSEIVFVKSALGGIMTAIIALAVEPLPDARLPLVTVFACGVFGYGAMERFYLLAQRHLGIARASSISAMAPFFAATIAVVMGAEVGPVFGLAGLMMAFGLYMHASERPTDEPAVVPAPERSQSRAAGGP